MNNLDVYSVLSQGFADYFGFTEKEILNIISYYDINDKRGEIKRWYDGYTFGVQEIYNPWSIINYVRETIYLNLTIPNAEIRSIYRNTILAWFDKKIQKSDMAPLFKAIDDGDCEEFGDFLSNQLLDTISFFDYAENYYHGFLTGLLKTSQKYYVYSNRESGTGRSDIILKTPSVRGGAVVMELKVSNTFDKMEDLCREALMQIEERDYEASLRTEGYRNILKYGICFYRKECMVMKAELC